MKSSSVFSKCSEQQNSFNENILPPVNRRMAVTLKDNASIILIGASELCSSTVQQTSIAVKRRLV